MRKSAASLKVVPIGHPTRIKTPANLREPERSIFTALVQACDPKHFRASDIPLLEAYASAIALSNQAANELRKNAVVKGRVSPWVTVQEKAVRAMVSLSLRLRVSPQARLDPKTLGREKHSASVQPWTL